MGWLILFIFSIFMTMGGIIASLAGDTSAIGVLIVGIVLDIVFYKKYRKSKMGVKEKQKLDAQKQKEVERIDLLDRTINVSHQAGLPLAEGAVGTIVKENEHFRIVVGGNEFSLRNEKITDICVKTDVEIQTQYVSSAGGAVAGGMLFGPLGAMVGGRAKQKNTSTVEYYLIFTYRSNANEICYASFKVYDAKKAREWEKEFKTNNSGRTGIVEL